MLPSSEALIPPHLQTPTRLNSVICQGIPLRCDQLLHTVLYTQKPPVLEDLYRWGVCRGARGAVEARGHRVPIPKGFGTQSSAEVVTDLYWTLRTIRGDHPTMQSHKEDTARK